MLPMMSHIGSTDILKSRGYLFEPKLDGTRALCHVSSSGIKFINRKGRDITSTYPELKIKSRINSSCILDGEIVMYNEEGNPDFQLMLKRENSSRVSEVSKEYPGTYVVFDILSFKGKPLTQLPLEERKNILEKTVRSSKKIEIMPFFEQGEKLWKYVKKRNLEGVVAKRKGSIYMTGDRSRDWLKIKNLKTCDCVIVGYTSDKRALSALALGVYNDGKLIFIGHVGTGFSEAVTSSLLSQLEKIRTVKNYSGTPAKVQNVLPQVVCEVRYLEFSRDGMLRAPSFLRLRTDKAPQDCIFDQLKQSDS